MRGTFFLGFLLTLPPLAALGHDLYLAYWQKEEIDITEPFHLSDVGWLWEKYSSDTLRIAKAGFDPSTWQDFVLPVLKTDAVIAAGIPALIFFATIFTLKAMRSGAFALKMGTGGGGHRPKKSSDFGHGGDRKAAPVKYKRK